MICSILSISRIILIIQDDTFLTLLAVDEKDKRQQMERWVEHYLELYTTRNVVSDAALNAIPDLPVLDELDVEPSMEELSKAIDCLSTGKAPGEDGIPPEIIKCGKDALLRGLHELLCLCWREGVVPKDMRNAKIVTL